MKLKEFGPRGARVPRTPLTSTTEKLYISQSDLRKKTKFQREINCCSGFTYLSLGYCFFLNSQIGYQTVAILVNTKTSRLS